MMMESVEASLFEEIEKTKQLEIEERQQDSIHIVSKAKEVSHDSSQVLPLPPNQTLLKS